MADTYIDQAYIDCGFFDAVEVSPGVFDRIYDADSWSKPYRRIVSDGIFEAQQGSTNSDFKVKETDGETMNISISHGDGIFWTKWFSLTSDQVVTVENNNTDYTRIDSIIVQIDMNQRLGQVLYRPGLAAEDPVPPALTNNTVIKEWRIANIEVEAYATEIMDANIVDRRGIETPFIASLIQTLSTEDLFTQWNELYSDYFDQTKATVEAFLRELTEELTVSMYVNEVNIEETLESDTTTFTISGYDKLNDVIFVYVNGITLSSSDYTVNDAGTTITFTNLLRTGTKIHVKLLKSVKAPIAEGRAF